MDKTEGKKLYTQEELSEHLRNQEEQIGSMIGHLNGRITALDGEVEDFQSGDIYTKLLKQVMQQNALLKEKDGEIGDISESLGIANETGEFWKDKCDALKQKVEGLEKEIEKGNSNFIQLRHQESINKDQQVLIDQTRKAAKPFIKATTKRKAGDYFLDDVGLTSTAIGNFYELFQQACTDGEKKVCPVGEAGHHKFERVEGLLLCECGTPFAPPRPKGDNPHG